MIEDIARLSDLAEGQHGQVTVQQAAHVGVPHDHLKKLVTSRVAEWVVPDAVLRLRAGGHHPFPRLYAVWLQFEPATPAWERAPATGAVASHGSALRVHGLGALAGPSAEFTLPAPSADVPPATEVAFHRDQLKPGDWQSFDGLPVTTPVRTLIDIAASRRADMEQLGRFAATLLHKHLATEDEVAAALDAHLREQGLDGTGSAWLTSLLASADDTDSAWHEGATQA